MPRSRPPPQAPSDGPATPATRLPTHGGVRDARRRAVACRSERVAARNAEPHAQGESPASRPPANLAFVGTLAGLHPEHAGATSRPRARA